VIRGRPPAAELHPPNPDPARPLLLLPAGDGGQQVVPSSYPCEPSPHLSLSPQPPPSSKIPSICLSLGRSRCAMAGSVREVTGSVAGPPWRPATSALRAAAYSGLMPATGVCMGSAGSRLLKSRACGKLLGSCQSRAASAMRHHWHVIGGARPLVRQICRLSRCTPPRSRRLIRALNSTRVALLGAKIVTGSQLQRRLAPQQEPSCIGGGVLRQCHCRRTRVLGHDPCHGVRGRRA
jgi:hypothetical protein